jgi:hypothetical protein
MNLSDFILNRPAIFFVCDNSEFGDLDLFHDVFPELYRLNCHLQEDSFYLLVPIKRLPLNNYVDNSNPSLSIIYTPSFFSVNVLFKVSNRAFDIEWDQAKELHLGICSAGILGFSSQYYSDAYKHIFDFLLKQHIFSLFYVGFDGFARVGSTDMHIDSFEETKSQISSDFPDVKVILKENRRISVSSFSLICFLLGDKLVESIEKVKRDAGDCLNKLEKNKDIISSSFKLFIENKDKDKNSSRYLLKVISEYLLKDISEYGPFLPHDYENQVVNLGSKDDVVGYIEKEIKKYE